MEIPRLKCLNVKTGRVRMIIETLAKNPVWMAKHDMELHEVEKPKIEPVKKVEVVKEIEVVKEEIEETLDPFQEEVKEEPKQKRTRKNK